MSERYEQLQRTLEPIYVSSSPLLIAASALLKDTKTGEIVAQVKFQNIDNRLISAVFVDFEARDISGNVLDGISGFQYLDLKIKRGDEFGSKTAVIFPDNRTRQFTINVRKVIFADSSERDYSKNELWTSLPAQQTLDSVLSKDLNAQYIRETNEKAHLIPLEFKDLWQCTCGELNHQTESHCYSCGLSHDQVFMYLDQNILSANFESFEEKERLKKKQEAEQAAKKAAEDAERKNKQKQIIKLAMKIGSAIVIVIAAILIITQVIIPENKYKQAQNLLTNEKYDEAIAAFQSMGDYKDSLELIKSANDQKQHAVYQAQYDIAKQLLEEGEYDKAAEAFGELISHIDDAATMVSESYYQKGEALLKDERFDEAIEAFTKANAKDRVHELYYQEGEALLNDERFDEAIEAFTKANAEDRVSDIRYQQAETMLSEGMYLDAIDAFKSLNNYKDAKKRANDAQYQYIETARQNIIKANIQPDKMIAAGTLHSVGLKIDGTVLAVGSNEYGQCDVSDWNDIIAIDTGDFHTIGLKPDGTVIATGHNKYGQCDVSDWRDIIAIDATEKYTAGLKADGTVVITGKTSFDQEEVSNWSDISAITGGESHVVGLKADGTVIAAGSEAYGKCAVSHWCDIVDIFAGRFITVGVKSDGSIVTTDLIHTNSNWKNITSLINSSTSPITEQHTAIVTSNGKFAYEGTIYTQVIDELKNEILIAMDSPGSPYHHYVALKPDGSVIAFTVTGIRDDGQDDVSDWQLW